MSILRLPESLIPLTMHITPLLEIAQRYELGVPVDIDWTESNLIEIEHEQSTIRISFDGTLDLCGFRVKDQWFNPYPSVQQAKQMVEKDNKLLLCGIPVKSGVVDVWFYNGRARVEYSPLSGANESYRAMLLTALAVGYPMQDAITLARAYACSIMRGFHDCHSGWPVANDDFPIPLCLSEKVAFDLGVKSDLGDLPPFPKLHESSFGLYPIVDDVETAIRLLQLGVKFIQLRLNKLVETEAEEAVVRVIDESLKYQAHVFIRGQWQLAIKHHAYGVHLTQAELPTADLSLIQDAGLCLGLSTHGYYEIIRAMAIKPSYIAIGHVFPDATEKSAPEALGLNYLALYQELVEDFPTVAVGGITQDNAYRVWRTGVDAFAVTRAIENSTDLEKTIAEFNQVVAQKQL